MICDVLGMNNDCIVVKGTVWDDGVFGKQKMDAEKEYRRLYRNTTLQVFGK